LPPPVWVLWRVIVRNLQCPPQIRSSLCADQRRGGKFCGEPTMSYIDVAIPAVAGLLAVAWPQMFLRKPPDASKVRVVRLFGVLFLVVAAAYLAMRLAGV
jgi:hypothetical protein